MSRGRSSGATTVRVGPQQEKHEMIVGERYAKMNFECRRLVEMREGGKIAGKHAQEYFTGNSVRA